MGTKEKNKPSLQIFIYLLYAQLDDALTDEVLLCGSVPVAERSVDGVVGDGAGVDQDHDGVPATGTPLQVEIKK